MLYREVQGDVNLAHITDGLRAERERGITIDVAYKYFTTPYRKYILTDAPGHFQYTKNLVTGASNADLMIILIDAVNGITEQTKRHSLTASFLKIPNIIVAVNKMDIMGYDEHVFTAIKKEYTTIANQLNILNITYIPMSALLGDNVTTHTKNMPWYKGDTLLHYLENCQPSIYQETPMRFSIQNIHTTSQNVGAGFTPAQDDSYIPPLKGARGMLTSDIIVAGKLLSGILKVGDTTTIYPQQENVRISKILKGYTECEAAKAGDNLVLYISGYSLIVRSYLLAENSDPPICSNKFEANICWLNENETLQKNKEYGLRINSIDTSCTITDILYKTDTATFRELAANEIHVNEFARVGIETKDIIAYDPFHKVPENGRGIIIDLQTNYTSGAFTIL